MSSRIYLFIFCTLLIGCSSNSGDDSPPEVDSCNPPTAISTNDVTDTSAVINWSNSDTSSFQIEYGISGFNQGSGTVVSASGSSGLLSSLASETNYQFYIRSACLGGIFSEWVGPRSFTTMAPPLQCAPPNPILMYSVSNNEKRVIWEEDINAESFSIEHGVVGFTPGTGAGSVIEIETMDNEVTFDYLTSTGPRELYLRSNCFNGVDSAWLGPLSFFTNGSQCSPTNLSVQTVPMEPNSVYLNWGSSWQSGFSPESWTVQYGPAGFEFGTGTIVELDTVSAGYLVENLTIGNSYDFYVRANCSNGGTSMYGGFISYTLN